MSLLIVVIVSIVLVLRKLFQMQLDHSQIFTVIIYNTLKRFLSDPFRLDNAVDVRHDVFLYGLDIRMMLLE